MVWKIGLIGAGFWSSIHLNAWQSHSQNRVEIAALCDTDHVRLQERAAEFHIPPEKLFRDIDDMLAHADLDIVDIATPPDTHAEIAIKAARAGKHILCQKPFAPSIEEAERMVHEAKVAGVRLMVSENWRWLEPIQCVKRILDQGELGDIYSVKYSHMDFLTPLMTDDRTMDQPYLRHVPRLIFYDMGVHWCDVWRFLFGEPKRLYAEFAKVSREVKGEDLAMVVIGHDRFQGMMDMSWATRLNMREPFGEKLGNEVELLAIEGTEGTLVLDSGRGIEMIDNKGGIQLIYDLPMLTTQQFVDSFARLQRHFLEGVEQQTDLATDGSDNLLTLRMTYSAYESANEHKLIVFSS